MPSNDGELRPRVKNWPLFRESFLVRNVRVLLELLRGFAALAAMLGTGAFLIRAGLIGMLLCIFICPLVFLVVGRKIGDLADSLDSRVRHGSVSLGSDGVLIRGWLRRSFVPYSRISKVARSDREPMVILELTDGTKHSLRVQKTKRLHAELSKAVRRRRDSEAQPSLGILEYRGEHPAEWVGRIRALRDGASYRDASVSEDDLARIAEDPAQPADQRIGASIALAESSEDTKRRVRIAISETLEPELAEALAQALRGDAEPPRLARVFRTERR